MMHNVGPSRRVSTLDAEERANRKNFYHGFFIATILGIGLVALVVAWALAYGGLRTIKLIPDLLGIHMVFMVTFVLILHSFSSLMYRLLAKQKKGNTKLIHAGFHFLVFIGSFVGFAAAIAMHNQSNPPSHFSSIHSWLGLTTLCIYYLQFLGGVITFLLQIPGHNIRVFTLPIHKLIGQLVLYFACGSVLTGLFSVAPGSPGLPMSLLELNIGALLTICFVFNVIYLLTAHHFRRPIFAEIEPLLVHPQK